MKDSDKQKVRDAWEKAVAKNPNADKPVEGMVMNDGTPATPRKLAEITLADESFYDLIDEMLDKNKDMTLDKWLPTQFPEAFTP
jgi:hypothetical protein